jgi:hypothetical protein
MEDIMILRKPTTSILSAYVFTGTAVASVMVPAEAMARHGAKPYYSETYETGRPVRGYEGFLFPDYYCSYKRYPKRVCSDWGGRGSCRVVGWTLEQTCQ